MNHSAVIRGRVTASVTHRPWRTTRLIWRGWRAPLACAIRGAVALATPTPNIMPVWNRAAPRLAAARALALQPAEHHDLGRVDQDLGELGQDQRQRQGEHGPELAHEPGRGGERWSSPPRLGWRTWPDCSWFAT